MHLRLEIANPDVRVEKTADGCLWLCASAVGGRRVEDLPLDRAWSLTADDLDDGTVVGMTLNGGRLTEVRAFRAPASSYNVFFVRTGGGGLLLTDQFARALAALPPEQRTLSREALADHLLFRTVPGARTYVSAVGRVAHGEEIVWRPGSPEIDRRVRCKLGATAPLASRHYLEALDSVLAEVVRPLTRLDAIENMLSGGIDSTLIHTYLGSSIPSVSAALSSEEFKFEVAYALEASRLLGTRHRLVPFDEATYAAALERCIEALGMPPHHLQTVLFDAVFRSSGLRFITAQFADALFGLDVAAAAHRVWNWRWAWRCIPDTHPVVRAAASVGLGKLRTLVTVGHSLARSPMDPQGFASRFATFTDMRLARDILGPELVAQRLEARLAYAASRLDASTRRSPTPADHIELGHFTSFFCDDAISLWRQSAQAHGKALYAPFNSRRLCETALRIPAGHRYVRHGRFKHLLKDLLAKRLPAYRVDQGKGSSGLPFARFWTAGPLKGIAERYPPPDFLERRLWKRIGDEPTWLAWNVVTLAMWKHLVLERTGGPPPPTARVFEA